MNQLQVNNLFYDDLGDKWYHANDDPVALLRAESKLVGPWIVDTAIRNMDRVPKTAVDLGCGGGFISNYLASVGLRTTGFDLSENSLAIARAYDKTNSVRYRRGDVTRLPIRGAQYDLVTCCDVIEHVEKPEKIFSEAFRILRPGGMFFFHTFNRNLFAHFVVIKLVEWYFKNTPENMHILSLFVKPCEVKEWSHYCGFKSCETIGMRPSFRTLLSLESLLSRSVPQGLEFKFCRNEWISFAGYAIKE